MTESDKVKLILANEEKIKNQALKNRREMGVEGSDGEEDDQLKRPASIFDFGINSVELRK